MKILLKMMILFGVMTGAAFIANDRAQACDQAKQDPQTGNCVCKKDVPSGAWQECNQAGPACVTVGRNCGGGGGGTLPP